MQEDTVEGGSMRALAMLTADLRTFVELPESLEQRILALGLLPDESRRYLHSPIRADNGGSR